MYVCSSPLHQVFEQMGCSTSGRVEGLLLSVRGSVQPISFFCFMLPSYWASILCRRSLSLSLSPRFKSLHRMWESIGAGSWSGRTPPPPIGPPATRLNAYLVLRPPRGDFVGIRSYKRFFFSLFYLFVKETQTTTTTAKRKRKRKMVCIGWEKKTCGGAFAVRSPGVASFLSLSFFFLLPGLLLFSYSITLFHPTLPRGKGMQMADKSNCL